MTATFQEWMTEGIVSCRGIMAMCPAGVERSLQIQAFAAVMETDASPETPTHWFRLTDQGKDSYICWRDDHTGAFEASAENVRKAGVDPAGLPVLELDTTRHVVPDSVASFQARLDAALTQSSNFSSDERGKLTALRQCLGGVIAACGEGYTDRMTVDGLETLLPVFSPESGAVSSAQKLAALADMQASVLRMRAFFAADVFLTARLDLFVTLLTAIAARMTAGGAEESGIVMQMTRFFFTPYSEAVSRPARLLPNLVEKMAREGYGGLVEDAAKERFRAGVSSIEAALDADNLDDYGALLYAAASECFAASHLYEILDVDAKRHPARPGGAWWAQSSKVAEEKLVRCANALFRLSDGPFRSALDRHRARVAAADRSGGEDARRAVVNDLIENNYFYPRCFETRLTAQEGT